MSKFNKLFEELLTEKEIKKGTKVEVTASDKDLGPKHPFKTGDIVYVDKFIGFQGNEEEYVVTNKKGKDAYLTNTMFKIL